MIIGIGDFLKQLKNNPRHKRRKPISVNGVDVNVKTNSPRMKAWLARVDTSCAFCRLKAEVAYVEKCYNGDTPVAVWRVAGYNSQGKLVNLTIDHIIPKALGGTDSVSNLQTLCWDCNQKKGSMLPSEYILGSKQLKSKISKKRMKVLDTQPTWETSRAPCVENPYVQPTPGWVVSYDNSNPPTGFG